MPEISPNTAKKRARAARWLQGDGVEIGALHNPLSLPSDVRVRYVDRMSNSALHSHYPELEQEELVPVDIIGDAQNLHAFETDQLDFVIANHLIEHMEDPIRALAEMSRVLRPGGILYLAVPDPRNTFDKDREPTDVTHIVKEFRHGVETTKYAHYLEWVELVEGLTNETSAAQRSRDGRVRELIETDYSIHFHVWRPEHFIEFLVAAKNEAGVQLELAEFLPCQAYDDNEFIFVLIKGHSPTPPDAQALPEETKIIELSTQLDTVSARCKDMEARASALEEELRVVYASRSWKVTKPLRRMARGARIPS